MKSAVMEKEKQQTGIMQIPEWWTCPEGHEELQKAAHALGEKELLARALISDQERKYPRESLRAIAEAGYSAVTIPVEAGGLKDGFTAFAVLSESFARYCPSTAMCWVMHMTTAHTIYEAGTEEQRQRLLPRLRQGHVGGLAFSERATGGHFWNIGSEAKRNASGYLLNAEKSFVTSGGEADFYLVATTSPETEDVDNLMFLLVENDQRGVEAFPFDAMGLRGNASGPMNFTNVQVALENRIGGEGGMGYFNDNTIDPLFLLGSAACWIGIAQGALNMATDGAKRRVHADTGSSVADYQVIRHELAKAQIQVDSARSMLYRVSQSMDRCDKEGKELSETLYPLWQLKTHAADMVIDVTNAALQVAGGRGYMTGQIEKFVRDGRAGAIMGPTNEVLREWIGRTMIEVPWMD